MKLKLLYTFVFFLSCKILSAQSYETFTWSNAVSGMTVPHAIKISPDDSIYIAGGNGYHVIKDSTVNFYPYSLLPGNTVVDFAFENNIVWLATDSGLVKRTTAQTQVYTTGNSGIISNDVRSLLIYNNELWIITDIGLSVFDGSNWVNTPSAALGLPNGLACIGRNTYGVYILSGNSIAVNSGAGWSPVSINGADLSTVNKFRNLSPDTLCLATAGAYLVDNNLHLVEAATDPCLFKDKLYDQFLLMYNKSSGEKYLSCRSGYNVENILQCDNFIPDYSTIKTIPTDELGNLIKLAYQRDFSFDYSNSGKLYWFIQNSTRTIFSADLNIDSFAVEVPFESCPYLDINQVRARIWNNGSLFMAQSNNALYEVPKGSGKSPIFSNGFWIGGLDQNQQLHIAAQTYRQSGSDFWPGPLDTITATIDSSTLTQYDSIWKIDRSEILEFIFQYANGNVQNGTYPIPQSILNWPASGAGSYSRELAPFYDNNNDGVYEPYDGDYPKIQGSQELWWVMNDNYGFHGETRSDRNLGVEIHGAAYAYNCPFAINNDSVINYTTFYHYDIYNRSDTNYHDVFVGVYTDVDLGNYLDDYVGCDTINDYGFAYNGDDDDEGEYGLHPPMINNLLLSGPEAESNDGLDNNHNGVIDELGEKCMMNHFVNWQNDAQANGNPNRDYHYINYMNSMWKDSSHVTYGANGFYSPNQIPTNYMFSGVPYNGLPWTELVPDTGAIANQPSDRRFLISSGPFNLDAHQKKSIDIAYVYTRDPNNPNGLTTSIARNTQDVLRIKQYYESNNFPCDNVISVNEIDPIQIALYPNPADKFLQLSMVKHANSIGNILVMDALGKVIYSHVCKSEIDLRIPTAQFLPGIYFLRFQAGDKIATKKFVVQHSN